MIHGRVSHSCGSIIVTVSSGVTDPHGNVAPGPPRTNNGVLQCQTPQNQRHE